MKLLKNKMSDMFDRLSYCAVAILCLLFFFNDQVIAQTFFQKSAYTNKVKNTDANYTIMEQLLNEFGKDQQKNRWRDFLKSKTITFGESNKSLKQYHNAPFNLKKSDKNDEKNRWRNFLMIKGIEWDLDRRHRLFEKQYYDLGLNTGAIDAVGSRVDLIGGRFYIKNFNNFFEDIYVRVYRDSNGELIRMDIGQYGACVNILRSRKECFNEFKQQFNSNIKLYDGNFVECKSNDDGNFYMKLEYNNMDFYVIIDNIDNFGGRLPSATVFHIFNEMPYSYIGYMNDFRYGYCKLIDK